MSTMMMMMFFFLLSVLLLPSLAFGKCSLRISSEAAKYRPSKLIIAHRGASYYLPEHTLEAYRLAMELNADYIEPDLVSTKDGHLIAMHTWDLNVTTNIQNVFPSRRAKFSKHANRTGFWAYEFTLEEIKTLRVQQRLSNTGARSTAYDGLFQIPTLNEIWDLVQDYNTRVLPLLTTSSSKQKKQVGVYAELKHAEWLLEDTSTSLVELFLSKVPSQMPSFPHDCLNVKFDEYVVPPLVVQSFDLEVLQEIHDKWPSQSQSSSNNSEQQEPPMVWLVDKHNCLSDQYWYKVGEAAASQWLNGVGPDKSCLEGPHAQVFVNHAKEHKVVIHPWAVRPELEFSKGNGVEQELVELFCKLDVDGVFVEDVDMAVQVARLGCQDANNKNNNKDNHKMQQLCYNTDNEAQLYVGLAAGAMGLLVGSIAGIWLSQSQYCKSRRHARRQLQIPTQDEEEQADIEMV